MHPRRDINRRQFIASAVAAATTVATASAPAQSPGVQHDPFWGYLLHLTANLWGAKEGPEVAPYQIARPFLRFDDSLWNDLLDKMPEAGVTLLVLDLGDGVRYDSHPEIAVENAWSVARLKEELAKIRALKIEVVPMLNFSAAHDQWLGQYARQISTDVYFQVCGDLIGETIKIFGTPRLFHIGMDLETIENQKNYEHVVVRTPDAWWHDVGYLMDAVQKRAVRPWVWADHSWQRPDEYYKRMPTSILQSSYYFGPEIDPGQDAVKAYIALAEHGYDEVPAGSNLINPLNFEKTVMWCAEHVPSARVEGFLQTTWKPAMEAYRQDHIEAMDQLARARVKYAAKVHMPAQA